MPDFLLNHKAVMGNDPGKNMVMSVDLCSVMIFPDDNDFQRRGHYKARCLLQSVPFLIEECGGEERYVDGVLLTLVKETFGTWDSFTSFIFPSSSKIINDGYLKTAMREGELAGMIFNRILHLGMGVRGAVKDIISEAKQNGVLSEYGGSETNLYNNIWKKRKSVAHWWGALLNFDVTEPKLDYIALESLVHKHRDPNIEDGLVGFVSAVIHFYNKAVDDNVGYKRSGKKLVDTNKAWKLIVE